MEENRFADLAPREVLDRGRQVVADIRGQIGRVIVGEEMLPFINVLLLTPFVSGGHLLVRAPVGMGKTTTLDAFARAIGGGFNRMQCRPDMLPSPQAIGGSQHKMSAITYISGVKSPDGRGEKLAGNYLVDHHKHQRDHQPAYT